ncbi:MAG TPA: UDP-glucose 4-epimerase GalE [Pyrinomonadaceae bacterium]|nr:UDP-glucose 4-epimerase GalE [Acidobacteriota bacterium]HQZ96160.1 UDP-glucose 4-epimerase GalE [Pyrinomonadaceae bacterium]
MSVLVTGGAGYIGSATVELLRSLGRDVVVLDNLVYGHREAVEADVPFYQGDVGDRELVKKIVSEHEVDACVHFAAYAYVGESVTDPAKYFGNNTLRTNDLLNTLIECDVKKFVFSSTCATYGDPVRIPIDETHPQKPVNPYGWSKFMTERILESYDTAYGLKFVALRYFNASGATSQCGEHHEPETHLIPNVLNAADGTLPFVSVFGTDYATPDGTCVRDYIHVSDLGDAHIKALDLLSDGGGSTHINLGNGVGFSVLEVIEAARKVTGNAIEARMEPRRAGDPSHLIADSTKAVEVLGWKPGYTDIESIIKTAWDWKTVHPNGYE